MQATSSAQSLEVIHRGCITNIRPTKEGAAECVLSQGAPVILPAFLAAYLGSGDEVEIPLGPDQAGVEIHVRKSPTSRRIRELYQASVGYITQPKEDKRKELFVAAEAISSRLGIATIYLSCHVLRDYFYVGDRQREWGKQPTLYEIVRIPQDAGPAELRLSFKIRQLELQKEGAPKGAHKAVERAYNILAQPELRACYDTLLKDPDSPVLFPYGGFGSILVAGNRSRDGKTFFALRLLAFRPKMHQRCFHAPLRKFEFYDRTAVYRDARRKLEVAVDQSVMPVFWDQTWNQWKHLVGAKVQIEGAFLHAGKYRMKSGERKLIEWESAVPSRLSVKLPANFQEDLDKARTTYHRFGQYAPAFDRIRARIQRQPMERAELNRLLGELGVPGNFDVAQVTWRADYDVFFYRYLAERARRLYLFREEYIFDLVAGIAVETPQLGHATYLFAKPQYLQVFLALYTTATKEDIRTNRGNIAERLGFLGRLVHGSNPGSWLAELKKVIGEPIMMREAGQPVAGV